MRRRLALLGLAAALFLPAAAWAIVVSTRTTTIISSPPESGVSANGDSDNVAFSEDGHNARLAAFDSASSNLVGRDANGKRDVFLFTRGTGPGNPGGSLSIASAGPGGVKANGDSTKPAIDGTSSISPHCVVFESRATNLDSLSRTERRARRKRRLDRSTDSDIYLRDTRSGTTRLVSVGLPGARNATIDGRCENIAFEAGGRVYVRNLRIGKNFGIATGTNPDQQNGGKGAAGVCRCGRPRGRLGDGASPA